LLRLLRTAGDAASLWGPGVITWFAPHVAQGGTSFAAARARMGRDGSEGILGVRGGVLGSCVASAQQQPLGPPWLTYEPGGETAGAQGLRRSPAELWHHYVGAVIASACLHYRQQVWARWFAPHVGSSASCAARGTPRICGLRGRCSWVHPCSWMRVGCWRCRRQ
jgi:hypothetical protein